MIRNVIAELRLQPQHREQVELIQELPPREAVYKKLDRDLPPELLAYLFSRGFSLFSHQCEAIKHIRNGENVIITTPTASGKTLAFNLPIFEQLAENTKATALYLYPTKALSNDQLKKVQELEKGTGIRLKAALYDGDTPQGSRPQIRNNSRLVISNPYELHQVLPWHHKWQKFLANLSFVVIDETHYYRGVFGSNVAFLVRRLRRICHYYGSHPQFILSTATLANAREFGEKLVGLDFKLIDEDGSPTGKKYFVFYNPYYDGVGKLSVHQETRNLFLHFIRNDLQTLCFTVSRKMAELITFWARNELQATEPELGERITAYRAGYLPEKRREIEGKLKSGYLKGVTSTNALELGIDIGSLDSVLISGYPGTIISTWQQAGRAGRGTDESSAVLVAFHNPLDQYFMKHPQSFFDKSHEYAIIDIMNDYIMFGHMVCMAAEMPIDPERDRVFFGDKYDLIIEALKKAGLIQETPNGWVYSGKGRATELVSLNNLSQEIFKVLFEGRLLETMDKTQAYREAHPEAVLLHLGETYLVNELDLKNRIVKVSKEDLDYYTKPITETEVSIIKEFRKKQWGDFSLCFGQLEVFEHYIGYRIMRYDKVIGSGLIDLPPLVFRTTGIWFTLPVELQERLWKARKMDPDLYERAPRKTEQGLAQYVFQGGLHGSEHAMIGIMPFHVMCDRWDIGGVSTLDHPDTGKPSIFIYDGFEGGIGLTEKAYYLIEKVIKTALELVRDCPCHDGCPGCIYSPKCGNANEILDKKTTILILKELLSVIKA